MSILTRIRIALLRRELSALLTVDHSERNETRTTHDMMRHINQRAARIVELQNHIRALGGSEDDEPEVGDDTQRIPSSLFIPSKDPP